MANQLRFYAVVIPGLEKIVEQELLQLSGHHVEVVHGGVRFSGTYDTMYRVNLRARSITRVQLSLARKNAMNTKELESILTSIAWERFLYANQPLRFHITSVQSRLMHTGKIEDAVRKHLVNYPLPASTHELSEQKIYVYIKNNRCHIRMDTSGERLDRRGYRLESGKAPIRETIAAGLLKWMEWNASTPLVVPMCGSGTFAIEAAQMAQHIINARDYACLQWPSCKEKVWNDVKARSQQMQKDIPLCIEASDHHAGAVEIAIHNAKRAQVLDKMLVQQIALKDLIPNN